MEYRISIDKQNNFLYNYSGNNNFCEPIKTAFSTIKFDLMHAFFHCKCDPNYSLIHWALFGNLKDRAVIKDIEDY